MNWKKISQTKNLSREFIRKNKNDLDWKIISKCQTLKEDFIREFYNYVDWNIVSVYQKMSEEFVYEFKGFINWNEIVYIMRFTNKNILQNVIRFGNWLYIDDKTKKLLVNNIYDIVEENGKKWVECYKVVNNDYSDVGNSDIVYNEINKKYKTICDYNYYNPSGPGFICWTIQKTRYFTYNNSKKVIKVWLPLKSVCLSKNTSIRSNKMMVVDIDVTCS